MERRSSEFAPDCTRTKNDEPYPGTKLEDGLVIFPKDKGIREMFWPEEVFNHPAKYNCNLLLAVVEYLTSPGDTILDPMSGTGTTMLAGLYGRRVVLIEIEEGYHNLQQVLYGRLQIAEPDIQVIMLHGDCRKFLPLPGIDCIIFSPPYSDMIKVKVMSSIMLEKGSGLRRVVDYSKDPWNVGNLNYFMYMQVMEKVYQKLLQTAHVMAVVLKDRIKDGERVRFVDESRRMMEKMRWKFDEEIKLKSLGTEFNMLNLAKGVKAVLDESILIMRR